MEIQCAASKAMRTGPYGQVTKMLHGLVSMGARSEEYISDQGEPVNGLKTDLVKLLLYSKSPQPDRIAAWYYWYVEDSLWS